MNKKKVTAANSKEIFEVDTSDEACSKFGFKHGDRIILFGKQTGTIMGVAPTIGVVEGSNPPRPDVLWFALDEDNGEVSYCNPLRGNSLELI